MQVVRWSEKARVIGKTEANAFFDAPLHRFALFNFTTSALQMPAHGGMLSFKTVLSGAEHYDFARRRVTLRPGQALLVNEGERYASSITTETESLSFFIPRCECEAALGANASDEALLEEPDRKVCGDFPQVAFRTDAKVAAGVARLRYEIDAETLTEEARLITAAAFAASRALAPAGLEGVTRRSVRDEILTRLLRARGHIEDHRGDTRALSGLAAVACMSPYHFLRRFQEAFGVTPARYARRLRLARSRDALARGVDRGAVARAAGFRSFDALTRALRKEAATNCS